MIDVQTLQCAVGDQQQNSNSELVAVASSRTVDGRLTGVLFVFIAGLSMVWQLWCLHVDHENV